MNLAIIRLLFIFLVAGSCYWVRPFGMSAPGDGAIGLIIGVCVAALEWRGRAAPASRLAGAAVGGFLGAATGYLFSVAIRESLAPGPTQRFLALVCLLAPAYVGFVAGTSKADWLTASALGRKTGREKVGARDYKILDTSVIIDGRIADIAETGFLEGIVLTPQFVLRELQQVADSSDSLRRNRGRRGLDILQRLQNIPCVQMQIVENDFASIREVDLKLIELAKLYGAKIITNDFNLNKVATVQGVEVLNINELAHSLRPIVLPGETMRVFILKEGKEYNQGIAYLDDGTMVVVDNARKMIGKTVDVSVTSVLQTTAGKMIFGKWDERAGRGDSRPVIATVNGVTQASPTEMKETHPLLAVRPAERG